MTRNGVCRAAIALVVMCTGSGIAATGALAASKAVKIAAVLPLSGASGTAGQAAENGAQLAIRQANGSHLVSGVTFSLVRRSDVGAAGTPDGAAGATQIRSLISDARLAGVVAPFDTPTALSELPLTNTASLAAVSPSAGDTCLTITATLGCTGDGAELRTVQPTGRTTFFRVVPADFLAEEGLANYLETSRFYRKVYVIDDSTAAGIGQADAFISTWQLDGGVVVGHASIPAGTASFVNLLTQAAALRPDLLVYAGNNAQTGIALRRQMAQVPSLANDAFAVSGALGTPVVAQNIGAVGGPVWAAAEPTLAELPAATAFASQYQAQFGTAATTDAARGYDAANALLNAIKAAIAGGATPPGTATAGAITFRTAVSNKLATVSFTGVDGPIAFAPNGDLRQGPVGIAMIGTVGGTPAWVPVTAVQVTSPAPTATLSPADLDFGSVPIHGGSAEVNLQLTNTGFIPFRASSITVSGDGFSIAGSTCTQANVTPASPCTVTVRFTPTATHGFKALVTVADPTDSSPQMTTVIGTGVTPTALTLPSTSLPPAATGVPYKATLTAHGGIPPYHWSIAFGSLPPGLSLDAATGAVTGTPTGPGRSQATVKLTDSDPVTPHSTTGIVALTVAPPVPAAFYVVNGGNSSVRAFALTAQGNAAPLSTLAGTDTQLNGTSAVTLTSVGGLYVANSASDTISEYSPGATGDARPAAVLSGPDTGLAAPQAIALDATGDLYVADRPAGTITVYAPGASGDAAPIRTITGLVAPSSLVFDHAGDLWVGSSQANTLTRFAAGASGHATPLATIAGADTHLSGPQGLTVNPAGDLLVANEFGNTIAAFDPAATGDVSPLFTLSGPDTGLSFPVGVDTDNQGDLYVSNTFDNKITVYGPGAHGDVAPISTIAGQTTGLATPGLLAVTPPLTILTRRLPSAHAGHHYRARIWSALGMPPTRWRIISGRIPRTLTLDPHTGTITGTPGHRTTAHFRVTVTDAGHPAATATRSFTLTVAAARKHRHRR